MIYGISGYAGSGKDTVGQAILDHIPGSIRLSFAQAVKDVLAAMNPRLSHWSQLDQYTSETCDECAPFDAYDCREDHPIDWHEAKSNIEVRRLLQVLGEQMRNVNEDVWVDKVMVQVGANRCAAGGAHDFVICDVRYPNEAEAIKDRGGVLIRVDRPCVAPANGHVSETALDDYVFDYRIENVAGVDELRNITRLIVDYGSDWPCETCEESAPFDAYDCSEDHGIDWHQAKTNIEVRRLLQVLGEQMRNVNEDVWVNKVFRHLPLYGDFVICDVRYPNEAEAIKSYGGVLIRVDRPGVGPANGHVSETALDDYVFDYRIENVAGVDELRNITRLIVDYGSDWPCER